VRGSNRPQILNSGRVEVLYYSPKARQENQPPDSHGRGVYKVFALKRNVENFIVF